MQSILFREIFLRDSKFSGFSPFFGFCFRFYATSWWFFDVFVKIRT